MKKVLLIVFIVSIGGIAFLPSPIALAEEGLVPCGPGTAKPSCGLCDFFVLIDRVVDFFLLPPGGLVPIVATLMIVIGGFMYIFAYASPTGGPEWISRAKRLFTSVAIGLIIAYGAWILISFFFAIIGVQTWTGLAGGAWSVICE